MNVEYFKIIVLGLIFCFVFLLLWISWMVYVLKKIDKNIIDSMALFFSSIPIKKFFNFFSGNNIKNNN